MWLIHLKSQEPIWGLRAIYDLSGPLRSERGEWVCAWRKDARAQRLKDKGQAGVQGIDDAALVIRARSGDSWAEEALVQRHIAELSRVIGRLIQTRQEAEDIVQDSLVKALETLPSLRDPGSFRSWLLRIGVNQARQVIRRRRFGRLLGVNPGPTELSFDQLAVSTSGPEIQAELGLVDEVLRGLPTNERIAWMLRFVEGFSLKEVAEACGCSLATVKRRVAAAHQKISAHVDIEEPDDG